jgi:DNA-binding XRE family transcriptional regulator
MLRASIRNFRKNKGYPSQESFAKSIGTNQQMVNGWELEGGSAPTYEWSQKLLEMGITVEELFGIEYNKIHNLGVQETLSTSSSVDSKQTLKKLNNFEADLLQKMSNEFASFDGELESMKKWKEIYKLEREIERSDNTTDITAKKQRLQELKEQIENEFVWLERFDTRELIKVLEDDLESMEETDRHNSYEKPEVRRRILDLQKQIENEMYSYVYRELKRLDQQESTKEKVTKWKLEQQLRKLQEEQNNSTSEQNSIKLRIQELEKELESLKKQKPEPTVVAQAG